MPNPPSFRDEFALNPDLIYLNSGTHSLCPRAVTEALTRAWLRYERNPTQGLIDVWKELWQVQQSLGRYLSARPQDLFLRANVTSAMNSFILGIPLPGITAAGEILVSDIEYGAIVNICRFRAEREGLKLRSFHVPVALQTDAELAEIVVRELRPETRLLLLSHVATGSGQRLPIELIARETRKRGVLLVVDGAHATGALALNFEKLDDVDFYGGNLHKWFMGPKGTGFGWVPDRHQAALEPREIGWTTYEVNPPYTDFAPGHPFAQKHFPGASIDFAPFVALREGFAFWKRRDPSAIRARLIELQNHVIGEMTSKVSWPLLTPSDPDQRGPLLTYRLPEALESERYGLMLRLTRDERLQIASSFLQGRWVLRISPHIHNTEAEISRAVGILAKL